MASEGVNIAEDAEMAECDGDKVVTMMDVLQEQQDFEEDANAVLGASDDKNCTYSKGYIKRQALYACLTCCTEARTDPTKRAGVCLACSLNCHENHELIELYTKRNFRCDCGNPKFNSHPCQFTPDKTDLNEDNIYNQNFSGLYCTCQRPYPDPESTVEDDMIQCIICEDWLHASHLEAVVPANDQYSEMVCKSCMEKNEFLHDYSLFAVTVETGDVDVITVNGDVPPKDLCNGDIEKEKLFNGIQESSQDTQAAKVTANGDVEMDENKENKIEESTAPETNDETKGDLSNAESTESKTEVTDKPDNVDDSKMDEITETNEAKVEGSNTEMESEETSKDITEAQTDNKVQPNQDKPEQNNETPDEKLESIDEKTESTDDKMHNTDNQGQEEAEKQEQNKEQLTKEENGGGDNVKQNINETTDRTEEQLLDELNEMTADKPTENKIEESTLQSETKNSEDIEIKKEESRNEDSTEDKQVSETEKATNVEVPDTSQPENNVDQNSEDKTDSVMDAIDELLQTANDENPSESGQDKESTSEAPENKTNADGEQANDVEMNTSKAKLETNDTTTNNTEDVEMTDEKPVAENKIDEQSPIETDTKNASEIENASKTDASVNEDKVDNESPTDEKFDSIENSKEIDSTKKTENSSDNNDIPTTENVKEHKRKLSTDLTENISPKKSKLECVRPKEVKRVHKGATFWPSNFRQKLCTCGECLSMYKDLKVLFLTDLEDTVSAYESLGKENVAGVASQYEKGLQALSSLDRIQQINALTEYNKMRDKLLDFLKSFKDRKEVVKEEDIKAFFAGMKPRREPDGVYFCR